jgi:hypothetical protein
VNAPIPVASLLFDFAPMAERAISIDAAAVLRFQGSSARIAGYVRLPYEVLAGRTVAVDNEQRFDVSFGAAEFLRWIDEGADQPARRDAHWLSPLPPSSGWRRLEEIPGSTVRELIQAGAELARTTDTRASQESLLSSVVLTASAAAAVASTERASVPRAAGLDGPALQAADVRLGPLSALTKMGFLPRGSTVAVDVAPGWTRVAAAFGSAYSASASPLSLLGGMLSEPSA